MSKTNRCGKSSLLSKNERELLSANLPEKYSLLSQLLYYTAGRVSEITTLRVRNINMKDYILTIEKSSTKTKETRQIPLPPSLIEHLKSWIDNNGLNENNYIFFTDSRNMKVRVGEKCVSTQSVDYFFRKAFDWIGVVGTSTHSFRRSRLTHLHVNEGWSLREIMDISGHKNLLSLQQYLDTDRKISFEKYRNLLAKEDI